MQTDPKVQRIIDWRESIALLPDNHFFEIIRMYLGEIKTPFNKQKLIEELGAFIRREENRKILVSLLSETDLRIITAVKYISNATQEKLFSFFSPAFTFANLYERLLNLEERLILYRKSDKTTGKTVVFLNPHLEEDLEPYTKQSVLLEYPEYARLSYETPSGLTPLLLAAFISYINKNPDICKSDGSFKKRTENELAGLFPGKRELLFNLTKAFINLSLLRETSLGYELDKSKLLAFASLDEKIQCAYLCVASQGHFSRNLLLKRAKLLLDVATSIPREGFSKSIILRLAYLISEDQNEGFSQNNFGSTSRFSQILNRARESETQISEKDSDLSSVLDSLIEPAALFGIFSKKGIDVHGEDIFVSGPIFEDQSYFEENKKCLSVDAAFNVTLMRGLSLEELIPVMDFMELKTFDTAVVFEINRKSVMRGFDAGLSANKIFSLLKKYSPYEIPQNLEISIEDWSKSYSSATIYKGYVLQVNSENATITEKNPAISPFISKILAPGIYLLSVESDEQAASIIQKSGLDFIGKIKSSEKGYESIGFPQFVIPQKSGRFEQSEEAKTTSDSQRAAHFEKMRSELEKLNLPQEKKEGLLQRIQHKIILSPAQLRADSVKYERIEAGGMDFSGKLHIVEGSISNNSLVELHFEDRIIVGLPLSVTKTANDATVLIEVLPEHDEKILSISQAKFVKRIRGSVLR